ncbi:hypothetical protein RI129_005948 [Pyrocoelia pectoralis]|uniref:Uncharacterized protein n=1 Tax=Pyrocoelia pectoralis TaxID=417401 RepID=A0AAN7ZMY7_9COLE
MGLQTPAQKPSKNNIETGYPAFLGNTETLVVDNNIVVSDELLETNSTSVESILQDQQTKESKYAKILPGVLIPTPFKNALFWPEPIETKKKLVKRQIKVPAVGTSDAWKEYYQKKEEKQKQISEEKENRKRKREESKKIKEQKTKKVKKTF